jgi:hypothetical protein
MQEAATVVGNICVTRYHCLIHQESLCAKSLKAKSMMTIITKVVNFICSKGMNHREFQDLLQILETEFEDVVYYCEVQCQSHGKMLKRMFSHKEKI